jgi:hypothetical protein
VHEVKEISIDLSNEDADRGYLKLGISTSDNEQLLSIVLENTFFFMEEVPGCKTLSQLEIPISVAIAMRDFLNYALPIE